MPEKNENCLVGYRCPACGSLGPFKFPTKCWAMWSDDGTDQIVNCQIDDDEGTSGQCVECNHQSWLDEFKE